MCRSLPTERRQWRSCAPHRSVLSMQRYPSTGRGGNESASTVRGSLRDWVPSKWSRFGCFGQSRMLGRRVVHIDLEGLSIRRAMCNQAWNTQDPNHRRRLRSAWYCGICAAVTSCLGDVSRQCTSSANADCRPAANLNSKRFLHPQKAQD